MTQITMKHKDGFIVATKKEKEEKPKTITKLETSMRLQSWSKYLEIIGKFPET